MIQLYTAPSPNDRKVRIALEELGLAFEPHPIDMKSEGQKTPEFTSICPNQKIPVIDVDGTVIWESGAILLYLAEHHDPEHRILSAGRSERWEGIQYAFFQAAGLGPNLGRLATQLQRPEVERNPEMVETFSKEVARLLDVIDRILGDGRPFLAGGYSIGDIMHFPWLQPAHALGAPVLMDRPRVAAWVERIAARPAVARAMLSAG